MKNRRNPQKLTLGKESIRKLNETELYPAEGGAITVASNCRTRCLTDGSCNRTCTC